MASNINKITADLSKYIKDTEKEVEEIVNEVIDDISTETQRVSPVRTGLFKSSWFVEVESSLKKTVRNTLPYAAWLGMGGRGTGTGSPQVEAGWIDAIILRALKKFK